jgi:hypothetical protein
MSDLVPIAGENDVLAMIKLFNDKKDYNPVFKQILNVDLSKANKVFYKMMEGGINAVREKVTKEYNEKQGAEQQEFLEMLGLKSMGLLQQVVKISSTWKDGHFRISDGYGMQSGKVDEVKTEKRGKIGEFIKGILDVIKSFFKKVFG